MFAADHALAGLLVKRWYRDVPLWPVLIGAQLMELLWVVLNLAGVERTVAAPVVRSVADIDLVYMPYSHSIATAVVMAAVVWGILRRQKGGALAQATGVAILSHLVLDLATHAPDIALAPGVAMYFGAGLYDRAPLGALAIELAFGVLCVWAFAERRPARALYAFAIVANLMNASLLWPALPGPEQWLGGRPTAIVILVFAQIIVTLGIVWALARRYNPR